MPGRRIRWVFPKNDRYFEIFEEAAKEGQEVATAFAMVASANVISSRPPSRWWRTILDAPVSHRR